MIMTKVAMMDVFIYPYHIVFFRAVVIFSYVDFKFYLKEVGTKIL